MKTNYEIRYAAHPEDAKSYDTARLRRDFLIEKVFTADEVNMVYSMYDRMVVGGAMPVAETLRLEAIDPLKAPFFLTRREMGIYNVGGPGVVKAGDAVFELGYKEALYLGSGDREVTFASKDAGNPAKFYFNSLTAHRNYPDKKVTKADAVVAHMGSLEGSNDRNINKMLVNQVLPTCQLQMGMTELLPGSVWNTMPARALAPHGGLFLFRSARGPGRVSFHGRSRRDAPHLDEGRSGRALARMVDPQRRSHAQLHLHLGHGRREPRLRRPGFFENNRSEIIHSGIFSKPDRQQANAPHRRSVIFESPQYRQSP